jgi:hypothetical protein
MIVSRVARRSSLASLVLTVAIATSTRARADQPATPTSPPEATPTAAPVVAAPLPRGFEREQETSWYGWQTLIADGTSVLVLPIVAGVSQSPTLGGIALGGYFLAPPFIHGAHGRWGMFAASLGLRVGMPIVGGLLGAAAQGDCSGELCIPVGAAIGVAIGALGAVALDASLLAYETVEPDPRYRGQPSKPSRVVWSPSVAPRKEGGFTLGLGAIF